MPRQNHKPKWYSIRPRILDYSSHHLALAAVVLLVILCIFILVLLRAPAQLRSSMIPLFVMTGSLFFVVAGAWHHKRRTRELRARRANTVPGLLQVAGTLVLIAIIGIVWYVLQKRGASSQTISLVLRTAGFVILAAAGVAAAIMRLKSR